jgi:hypothetical protein
MTMTSDRKKLIPITDEALAETALGGVLSRHGVYRAIRAGKLRCISLNGRKYLTHELIERSLDDLVGDE